MSSLRELKALAKMAKFISMSNMVLPENVESAEAIRLGVTQPNLVDIAPLIGDPYEDNTVYAPENPQEALAIEKNKIQLKVNELRNKLIHLSSAKTADEILSKLDPTQLLFLESNFESIIKFIREVYKNIDVPTFIDITTNYDRIVLAKKSSNARKIDPVREYIVKINKKIYTLRGDTIILPNDIIVKDDFDLQNNAYKPILRYFNFDSLSRFIFENDGETITLNKQNLSKYELEDETPSSTKSSAKKAKKAKKITAEVVNNENVHSDVSETDAPYFEDDPVEGYGVKKFRKKLPNGKTLTLSI